MIFFPFGTSLNKLNHPNVIYAKICQIGISYSLISTISKKRHMFAPVCLAYGFFLLLILEAHIREKSKKERAI